MFNRQDDSPDEIFYSIPRMVNHIDAATIRNITEFYSEKLSEQDELLDLMSSWVSHLPDSTPYKRVTGLGMNYEELKANPQLDEAVVQNLNVTPILPFPNASFNAVMIVVSVQYLTKPFDVFKEISRVLKLGGQCIVAMSHRLFPSKAIYAFQALGPHERVKFVQNYMIEAGFKEIEFLDRSPKGADPLWIVRGLNA